LLETFFCPVTGTAYGDAEAWQMKKSRRVSSPTDVSDILWQIAVCRRPTSTKHSRLQREQLAPEQKSDDAPSDSFNGIDVEPETSSSSSSPVAAAAVYAVLLATADKARTIIIVTILLLVLLITS